MSLMSPGRVQNTQHCRQLCVWGDIIGIGAALGAGARISQPGGLGEPSTLLSPQVLPQIQAFAARCHTHTAPTAWRQQRSGKGREAGLRSLLV